MWTNCEVTYVAIVNYFGVSGKLRGVGMRPMTLSSLSSGMMHLWLLCFHDSDSICQNLQHDIMSQVGGVMVQIL